MSADNYVVIRKFPEGYKWGDFSASDDPQAHPDRKFRSEAFPSWQEAMEDAYEDLCIVEYGYTVEDPRTCPMCGTVGEISVTSSRQPLHHYPGCEFDEEVLTCRACGDATTSGPTDAIIEQELYWWKHQHPKLARYMELLEEDGYTPTTRKIDPRPEDEILEDMDDVWDEMTPEEQGWVRDYMVWWNSKRK